MKSYFFRILVSAPMARGGFGLLSGDPSGPAVVFGVLLLAGSLALVLFDPLKLRRDPDEPRPPRVVRHRTEVVRSVGPGGKTSYLARCDGCAWSDGPFPGSADAIRAARFHDPSRPPVELEGR